MSALVYHRRSSSRARRRVPLARIARQGWRRARPALLVALPIVLGAIAVLLAIVGVRTLSNSRTAAAMRAGKDIAIGVNAAPELLMARVQFLLAHDRIDEVQPYVEALDRSGSDQARAVAHYNLANGRLRQAFDEITDARVDKAGPFVVLARQDYRRALTLEPEMWDAKFNLDVASRLIRDFPAFERTMGDEVQTKKKLWTDVPGKPEGLP